MAVVGGAEGFASLGALLTEVVETGIAQIIPDHCILQKMTPFNKTPSPQGLKHVQPTLVRYPDGFSHVVGGSGPSELNPAKAGKVERAEIQSNSIYLVDTIDKDMIDRTKNSKGDGFNRSAVKQATAVLFPALIAAAKREEEIVSLYGQSGRGKASVAAGPTWTGVIGTSSGKTTVLVDKADWGPGLWSGTEGIELSFFDDVNDGYLATASLESVNMDTRTLTLDTNITSLLTAATTASGAISIWRSSTRMPVSGTPQYTESVGLQKILSNTGTLFNISASRYNLYKSPQVDIGAMTDVANDKLSALRIMACSSRASYNGTGSGAIFLVPTDTWTDLATDETTFRRWTNGAEGKLSVGPDALVFHGATGMIGVKAHPMLKRGKAWMLNMSATSGTPGGDIKRIGDGEWEYDNTNGDVLHYVPGLSGYEIRLKCNKAMFMNPPGRSLQAYNIVDGQP